MARTKQEKVARNNRIEQYIATATGPYYLGKMILDQRQKRQQISERRVSLKESISYNYLCGVLSFCLLIDVVKTLKTKTDYSRNSVG